LQKGNTATGDLYIASCASAIGYQIKLNPRFVPIAGMTNLLQSEHAKSFERSSVMRTIHAAVIISLVSVCFHAPLSAAPKIFKWTDANGQVHFDSTPPPGQITEKVRIRKGVDAPPATPVDVAATTTATAAGEKPALSPEQRGELTKYCGSMRERISVLKQGGRVVEKNPDGSRLALNTDAVNEKLRADEGNVKTYCTANGL
jgi:hypothetical protein